MIKADPIKVAIIDHDKDFLKKSLAVLHKAKDIRVCASYLISNYIKEPTASTSAANDVVLLKPDVVLISQLLLRQVASVNLDLVVNIRDTIKTMRPVVTMDHYEEEMALIVISQGIRGHYMRKLGPSRIIPCVRAVAAGNVWFEPRMIARVFDEFVKLYSHIDRLKPPTKVHEERLSLLSPRETEILGLISKSFTNADIAKALFISEKTVKTHIRNIFEKTGIRNRAEAMLLVVRSGLASS